MLLGLAIQFPVVIELDQQLTLSIYNYFAINFVAVFFVLITNYTIGTIWGTAFLAAVIYLKKGIRAAAFFAISTGLVLVTVEIVKLLLQRDRPFSFLNGVQYLADNVPVDYSFPSGHTTLAFFIAFIAIKLLKLNRFWTVMIYLLAILVGVSRIYLGAHYFLDVVGGVLLGTLLGIVFSQFNYSRLKYW